MKISLEANGIIIKAVKIVRKQFKSFLINQINIKQLKALQQLLQSKEHVSHHCKVSFNH